MAKYDMTELSVALVVRQRFYASILNKMTKIATTRVSTAGVSLDTNNKLTLVYNPEWCGKHELVKALGVLEHEVLHIFLRHLQGRLIPRDCKDKDLRYLANIAMDMAINQHLPNLPEEGVYPHTFGITELDMPAEWYFKKLLEMLKQNPKQVSPPMPSLQQQGEDEGESKDKSQENKGKGKKQGKSKDQESKDQESKDQESKDGEEREEGQEGSENTEGKGQDEQIQGHHSNAGTHELWGKVVNEKGEIVEVSNEKMEEHEDNLENAVETIVNRAIKELSTNGYGKLPAFVEKIIEERKTIKRTVVWERQLKIMVNSVISTDRRLSQKVDSIRFDDLGYFVPGKVKSCKPKLLLVRDTSMSVNNNKFQDAFLNEMIRISKIAEIDVADVDTQIHQVYRVNKVSDFKKYIGGGGTSFVPAFEYARKKGYDGIIYLTDTYGVFPEKSKIGKYASKTIWVTLNQAKVEIPFGKHVNVTSKEE